MLDVGSLFEILGLEPFSGNGFRVSVVSLEIPGIVVSLEIPVSRIFSRKNSGKIVKIGFSDSRDPNKILKF